MLFLDGHVWWLVTIVAVIILVSVIALLTTDNSAKTPTNPLVLSDEERLSLQTIALEYHRKFQQNKRARRKGTQAGPIEDNVEVK